ncbi:DUF4232 domain-containing protein [Kitasatospora sp. NPDC052896]|uniref:DUF4232 domain-containing protein n=1 Tax=Kitasatospora sp. NPDC052896 TaxID=3364061 RepID=UPI0037C8AE77
MNPTTLTRGAAVALTTLALALGVAACNDDGSGSGAAVSAAPSAGSSAAAGGGAATGTGGAGSTGTGSTKTVPAGKNTPAAGSTAVAASNRCHTGDLKADVQLQSAGSAMVMLTNTSARTCTVDGYLGYGGLLADNSQVNLPTNRVAYPGAPSLITLKPNTTAFSGLKWSGCDKSDATCHVLAGAVVTPPNETTQLTANVLGTDGQPVTQFDVSSAGLTVGSLQPSNEGVVFQ